MNFQTFVDAVTIVAVMSITISAVLQAARYEMDFFGGLVMAFACALGGGSLRDLLIGATPVFWIKDTSYPWMVFGTTLLTIVAMRFITVSKKILWDTLNIADAAGLALFGILGTAKALEYGVPASIAPIMGVMTGVVGGMIRDVLTPVTPVVMRGELYASAVIIGAALYVFIQTILPNVLAMSISMLVIFVIRVAAIHWKVNMPSLRLKS